MAVFQQSGADHGLKRFSPVMILVIVLIVLLCCCCAVVAIGFIATGGKLVEKLKDLTDTNSYLPLYLSVRTWL
jgi:hypothetical protein